MANATSNRAERLVGGFASLLSSALTLKGESGVEPLKDSSTTLSRFISTRVNSDDICMVIPSLLLKHGETANSNSSSLEESAALNLSQPIQVSKSELTAVPMALLANFCESYTTLIDSRLRSSIQAFVRQSQRQRDSTLTRVLVGLLACAKSPISPSTLVTSFRVLPTFDVTANGEIVMPLVMETVVDLMIFGNLVTVNVVAPGTINAAISNDLLIAKAEIVLDTLAFLQSMMKQARFAVRKAVATASDLASNLLLPSSMPDALLSSSQQGASSSSSRPTKVQSSDSLQDYDYTHLKEQHQQRSASAAAAAAVVAPGDTASSLLMPPPPRRPSKRSLSDLSAEACSDNAAHLPTNGEQNASFDLGGSSSLSTNADAKRRAVQSGLSLLTAAAGFKDHQSSREKDEKKKKNSNSNSSSSSRSMVPPRKVTSCPGLEASV